MVTVQDTTPPTISLESNTLSLVAGQSFTAPTPTVTDNANGEPTVTLTGDDFDTSVGGEYTVTYTVIDASENSATVTLVVTVESDTTPPTIGLDRAIGTIVVGGTFTEPTITVTDNIDPNPTITSQGVEIDTSTSGRYTIIYTATDASQNSASATYTLNIISANSFVTTWRTTTDGESITIPTHSESTYNYTVDWGDGTSRFHK